MKKIIVIAMATITFSACSENKRTDTTTEISDTAAVITTEKPDIVTRNTYVPADGDVTYRNGKLMVWRNGRYIESDNDITMDDRTVIRRNGEATREGKVIKLEDGETVNRSGRWYNKAGEGIDDAWDATKKGVNKAAGAVKKAGEKVGEGIKDAVD